MGLRLEWQGSGGEAGLAGKGWGLEGAWSCVVWPWAESRQGGRGLSRPRPQHCTLELGSYIKDLSVVHGDLSSIVILDNSPGAYRSHPGTDPPGPGTAPAPPGTPEQPLTPRLHLTPP